VADPLRIVLVAPRNPLNIGAVGRAMSNFGFTEMRLVNPYDVAFKEARSAVHSQYILEQAQVFSSLSEAVADCSLVVGTTAAGRRDLQMPLYRLEPAAELLRRSLQAKAPTALLFGSEKFGLSNEDMSHCQWLMRIPAREEHGSMNLGQAVAICLYELRRDAQAGSERFAAPARVSAEEYERITTVLLDLLNRSGYLNPAVSESSELKVRRLVRRLGITAGDADIWLGMLRQILWKVGKRE
jgi:TrmH family RNA methyltransferase